MQPTFSILDQSIIGHGDTASEALSQTISLAKLAESLGYHRFWVAEHHDTNEVAGTSPEVLIAYILAVTSNIRVASGGVMLQHYSPYKVAENFGVLANLAPGRVDLGVGRSPGGLPRATKALQGINAEKNESLFEKTQQLKDFLYDTLSTDDPLSGVKAYPRPTTKIPLYQLGASVSSAVSAAELGLAYVFAQFVNGDPDTLDEAIRAYQEKYEEKWHKKGSLSLAVTVVVADTEEEAERLASELETVKLHFENGKVLTISNLKNAEAYRAETDESFTIELVEAKHVIKGTKAQVAEKIRALATKYDVTEFIIHTPLKNYEKRRYSYAQLADAFSLGHFSQV
ncbi:LLM class flavin-dependent oxidoreductase [Niallia sp. 01092]|uniref:LLM class flavin-dependent oxidoreductase n=1 Tax=unclassified Niallia TaxID=2837522 RepID=UPI003FD34233